MNRLVKWVTYVLPIIASILSIILVSHFNILNYISIVPADKRYDICIMLYVAISDVISVVACEKFNEKCARNSSRINVIFHDNKLKNLESNPNICIDKEMKVGEIRCSIDIQGNIKVLENIRLSIHLPKWVTVQTEVSEISLNGNRSTINLDLKKLLNANLEMQKCERDFSLTMIANECSTNNIDTVKCECEFIKKEFKITNIYQNIQYNNNSFTITY